MDTTLRELACSNDLQTVFYLVFTLVVGLCFMLIGVTLLAGRSRKAPALQEQPFGYVLIELGVSVLALVLIGELVRRFAC